MLQGDSNGRSGATGSACGSGFVLAGAWKLQKDPRALLASPLLQHSNTNENQKNLVQLPENAPVGVFPGQCPPSRSLAPATRRGFLEVSPCIEVVCGSRALWRSPGGCGSIVAFKPGDDPGCFLRDLKVSELLPPP